MIFENFTDYRNNFIPSDLKSLSSFQGLLQFRNKAEFQSKVPSAVLKENSEEVHAKLLHENYIGHCC